jgi:glycosyltransferase involved in cell wall biosynthesis
MNEISMVIAAYNSGKTLPATIESILAQKQPPKEIVFVNDGSVDNTKEVINKYAKNSNIPFRIIDIDVNGGVSKARNVGVSCVSFEYIAFCDSDDILESDHLLLLNELRSICPDSVVWFGNERIVDEDGRVRLESVQNRLTFKLMDIEKVANNSKGGECNNISGNLISSLARGSFIPVSGCLIKRSAFNDVCGFNENLRSSEDLNLFLKLSLLGRFSFTTSLVSNKLEHSGNITAVTRQKNNINQNESDIKKSLDISMNSARCLIDFLDSSYAKLDNDNIISILMQLKNVQSSCYYFSSKISVKSLLFVAAEFNESFKTSVRPNAKDYLRAYFYKSYRVICRVLSLH